MRFLRNFEVVSTSVDVKDDVDCGSVALGLIRFRLDRTQYEFEELIGPDGSVAASTGVEFDVSDKDSGRAAQRASEVGIEIRNVLEAEVRKILQGDPELRRRLEMTFA